MKNARMYQIPYINVSCSPDGSVKTFFDLCIEELERITGEIFYQKQKQQLMIKRGYFEIWLFALILELLL